MSKKMIQKGVEEWFAFIERFSCWVFRRSLLLCFGSIEILEYLD